METAISNRNQYDQYVNVEAAKNGWKAWNYYHKYKYNHDLNNNDIYYKETNEIQSMYPGLPIFFRNSGFLGKN